MSDRPEHPDFASLNDYVDGTLDGAAMSRIDKHLSGCAECSAELASLRALVAATGALPTSVLPDDDLWADLKAAIDDRKGAVLPTISPDVPTRATGSRWQRPAWLAAAAVVLVALSSATTAIVLRSSPETTVAQNQPDSGTTRVGLGAPPVLPASFRVDGELRDRVFGRRCRRRPREREHELLRRGADLEQLLPIVVPDRADLHSSPSASSSLIRSRMRRVAAPFIAFWLSKSHFTISLPSR